jgi:hypothetical protein
MNAPLLLVKFVPRAVVGGTRTIGVGIGAGILGIGTVMGVAGNAAAQGLCMLNPSRWGASSSGNGGGACKTAFESEDAIFEVGNDDDDDSVTTNGM